MFDDALKKAKKASSKKLEQQVEKAEEIKPKTRKSTGKRNDPDFKQVGAYIRKDTYLKIQRLLLEQPNKNFSDLVEELLTNYLNNQLTD